MKCFFAKSRSVIIGLICVFCWSGVLRAAEDNRVIVYLDEFERNTILQQMHFFMQGITAIVDALSKGDMETVAKAAHERGMVMPQRVPLLVRRQLPVGFTDIGKTVHMAFDQLAADARGFGDTGQSLQQLTDILQRCNACHVTYQIRSSTFDPMLQQGK